MSAITATLTHTRTRSPGVTIAALFCAATGIVAWLAAIIGTFLSPGALSGSNGGIRLVSALLGLGLGALFFAVAAGLWSLRVWAYWAAIVLAAIDLVVYLLAWALGNLPSWAAITNFVIPSVLMLYLLLALNVSEQFEAPPANASATPVARGFGQPLTS